MSERTPDGGDGLVDDHGLADLFEVVGSDERSTLILVESHDGLAESVVESIPERFQPIRRAVGAEASRAKVGCISDLIDLEHPATGAIVIENAQWVDATSMGRVQRLLSRDDMGALVVVAHTPVAPEDSWWLDQLAAVGERCGRFVSITAQGDDDDLVEPPSDPDERDLLLAVCMVSDPIPVSVIARFLDTSEGEALETAEGMVRRELLSEARSGFLAAPHARGIGAGEARLGHVAGRLATAFDVADGDPSVVGHLYLKAGNEAAAYPRLRDAAMTAQGRGAAGEAYHLAVSALAAAETASVGTGPEIGELHLVCGRFLRAAGRSQAASGHLEEAVALLEGPARIDALGFAAAVADDRQHPQEAERILAVAEWEAASQGELAKLGSIGTFRARALNRLGFAAESDALLAKATVILDEHATPIQQFYAEVNRAWILFDRGQFAAAEAEFTQLRDRTESHDLAGLSDKEAWRARALFATGHPEEALDAVDTAREAATEAEVEAPLFLSDLALAEGNLLFGRPGEALEATDRVLDLVERQLPAWENVARSNRALALLRMGRPVDAATEIEAALATTPDGADGWRWRARCRAIEMEITAARGRTFPQREAEDLADMLVQSEYYGWAADLLCTIAEQTRDAETAREAMAIAVQVGNPMLAARAAHAGKLWNEAAAAPVIRGIKTTRERLPHSWVEDWESIPSVAAALTAPEPADDETGAENAEILEEALRRAGLAGADTILSPAQRRGRGLVPHRRRRRSRLALIAAGLGVVVLAGATSFAVSQLTASEQPPVTIVQATPTTIPEPLSVEETQIDVPVDLLFGSALDRGDNGRSGYVDVSGPRTRDGYYWIFSAADAISATPLAYGNNLMVGSADGTFQAIDLTTGRAAWSLSTDDQIDASGAFSTGVATSSGGGAPAVGEGGRAPSGLVVIVGDDGVVRARDALIVTAPQSWSESLGATIKSSPVIDGGVAYVASTNGYVHALDLSNGNVIWRYPTDDAEPLGRITADLAMADGVVYVGTEDGTLHLIGVDGNLVCESTLDTPIVVNPVIVEQLAYISYGQLLRIIPAGLCPDQVPITEGAQFLSETVIDVAPAVVGGLIYIPNADFLNAVDRVAVEEGVTSPGEAHHWSEGKVNADGKIASPPVVTRDAVYFGTESGKVYAIDSDTGDELWTWQTGNYVRASPVVIEGAVYIASGDGNVYAVGPAG